MLNLDDLEFSHLTFRQAAVIWMELRQRSNRLKPRTHEATLGYLQALEKFFGDLRLGEITAGHIREYQRARAANQVVTSVETLSPWSKTAGNSLINHELTVVQQMLKRCRLWHIVAPNYSPLPVAGWSPREILAEEDEERLFSLARNHPECALAYWVACITNNTTAAGCELRGLRLEHLHLRQPVIDRNGVNVNPSEIYIPRDAVKNSSRPRRIALNTTAAWAVEQCYRRALALGSTKPEHYLFPFRVKSLGRPRPETTGQNAHSAGVYDPTRPATRWFLRTSWNKLIALAGVPDLKPHDLRHQCITRMLERGVEPETVRAIAGHVTQQMMEYYSHIRRQTKYAAVMAIEDRHPASARPAIAGRPSVASGRLALLASRTLGSEFDS